jgi:hypothetical protein
MRISICIALLSAGLFFLLNHFVAPHANSVAGAEIVTTFAFLCLVAIGLCLLQAFRAHHLSIKTILILALSLGILYQGWYWFTLFAESLGSANDGSCDTEIDLLASRGLTVPSTVDSSPHPAAYCFQSHVGVFRSAYQYIEIYSLQDRDKQSKAIQLITDFHKRKGTLPTVLLMYGQENWIKDGNGGGIRGPERVIRTSVIR